MTQDLNKPVAHITSSTPLQPAILAWEIYLQDQGKSVYTIKAFIGDLNLLTSFLMPDRDLGSITTNDLNNFLTWLEKERGVPCSPKSLSRRITSLKSFFRWLFQSGALSVDPAEKIVQKSVISPLPEVLTSEEETLIMDTANNWRQKSKPDTRYFVLTRLLLATGIKKGECLNIDINHLELNAEKPFLFIRYANPQYRYKERKIPLPSDWIEGYHEYFAQYKPTNKLFPWSPRRLEYLLEDLSNEAGISKHLSFDMCRWTSVLNDWNEGIEHEKIRQKLGISKIQWREVKMKLQKLAQSEETKPSTEEEE